MFRYIILRVVQCKLIKDVRGCVRACVRAAAMVITLDCVALVEKTTTVDYVSITVYIV